MMMSFICDIVVAGIAFFKMSWVAAYGSNNIGFEFYTAVSRSLLGRVSVTSMPKKQPQNLKRQNKEETKIVIA